MACLCHSRYEAAEKTRNAQNNKRTWLRIRGVLGGPPPQWRAQSHSTWRQWRPIVEHLGPRSRGLAGTPAPQWARVSPHRSTTSVPTVELLVTQRDSVGSTSVECAKQVRGRAAGAHGGKSPLRHSDVECPPFAADSPHTTALVRGSVGGAPQRGVLTFPTVMPFQCGRRNGISVKVSFVTWCSSPLSPWAVLSNDAGNAAALTAAAPTTLCAATNIQHALSKSFLWQKTTDKAHTVLMYSCS